MMPGFKTRLVQEIKHLLTKLPEFEEIKAVVMDNMKMNESCVPPNCMAWMGASIMSQLNSEIDKFEVTRQDYSEKYNEVR
jgi:actin-related protein